MKIVIRSQNVKATEDFALTPFIFLVRLNGKVISVYGVGIQWGWLAISVDFVFNAPEGLKFYKHVIAKDKKNDVSC